MDAHRTSAEGSPGVGGMMHVVPVTLLTHMNIYRFGTRGCSADRLYGGPWWVGVSAYDELTKLAARQARSLRDAARGRLATLSEWGKRDGRSGAGRGPSAVVRVVRDAEDGALEGPNGVTVTPKGRVLEVRSSDPNGA